MTYDKTAGIVVEKNEDPLAEAEQMSYVPSGAEGGVVYKTETQFYLVSEADSEVLASGKDVRAIPQFNRTRVAKELASKWSDVLDKSQRNDLIDWYADFVSELIEMDLWDDSYQTPCVGDTAYMTISVDEFQAEIAEQIGMYGPTFPEELAEDMVTWWVPRKDDPDDLGSATKTSFAAQIELVE